MAELYRDLGLGVRLSGEADVSVTMFPQFLEIIMTAYTDDYTKSFYHEIEFRSATEQLQKSLSGSSVRNALHRLGIVILGTHHYNNRQT